MAYARSLTLHSQTYPFEHLPILDTFSFPVIMISLGIGPYIEQLYTVEHAYDACPKYSELRSFRAIAYFYVSKVTAANIQKVQIKKYSVFRYSKAETHAMYAIYKQTRKLCVLQYIE